MTESGDYISREETLKRLCKDVCNVSDCQCDEIRCEEWFVIHDIPAADVRSVRRGKWIKYAPHNSDMMTCSECEQYWILDGDQYDYHFCPNCGADMRAEEGE
jgi:predicted RNA-binding Zn-ribbon protein involved in translation (DUF1610 family)